jgi:Uncharacterized alpha/beta hydrolase domain (DUF2235)
MATAAPPVRQKRLRDNDIPETDNGSAPSGDRYESFLSTRGKLKNLVLCLDGTWNSDDGKEITNIVRIRDLIDPKFFSPDGKEIWSQRVYYDTGVGTGLSLGDKYVGGGTGAGLEDKIRQAYRFLSQHDETGLAIYIFGFSRGAFTARSLAGFLGSGGLLRPEHCTRDNENRAWAIYRTPPGERFPSEQRELNKLVFPDVRIRCLGVFDTVGSRGIPTELFNTMNRRKYGFHDVTLGSNIDHALHALAIDELRGPFGASVWQYPNHKNNISVEQVWFPGVHANVGGGYLETGISDLTLGWMLSRIEAKKLGLRLLPNWTETVSGDSLGKVYDSRSILYSSSRLSPKIRVINQTIPNVRGRHRLSRLAPHAVAIGECIHWSALHRWTKSLEKDGSTSPYAPPNLVAAVDAMLDPAEPKRLLIVGESGAPVDWYNNPKDREKFMSWLPPPYRDKARQTLQLWEAGGVDMSAFLDISRPPTSPIMQHIATRSNGNRNSRRGRHGDEGRTSNGARRPPSLDGADSTHAGG